MYALVVDRGLSRINQLPLFLSEIDHLLSCNLLALSPLKDCQSADLIKLVLKNHKSILEQEKQLNMLSEEVSRMK